MADNSKIEWTNASLNPIRARNLQTGRIGWHCEHATTGCEFCYAEGFNMRLGTGLPFKPGHRKDVEIFLDEKTLLQPLRWKRPRMIFVCSMSDLFADFVTDEMIDRVFAMMSLTSQHVYQILTKRPERMRAWVQGRCIDGMCGAIEHRAKQIMRTKGLQMPVGKTLAGTWPWPHIWLGVSAERQEEADERIPLLLQTPGAVRFVSAEPLLGPIDLNSEGICRANMRHGPLPKNLDWVIVGGESGTHARPMHPQWSRDIRDQCQAAGVAFFFKQWGEHGRVEDQRPCPDHLPQDADRMTRVGKKSAGRLLDGREWNEFPSAAKTEAT